MAPIVAKYAIAEKRKKPGAQKDYGVQSDHPPKPFRHDSNLQIVSDLPND